MATSIRDWEAERASLQEHFIAHSSLNGKRLLSLEHKVFRAGALDERTKELLGLAASLVLRCEDCVRYHLLECHKRGLSLEELQEILDICLMIGGSITIPAIRRALRDFNELKAE